MLRRTAVLLAQPAVWLAPFALALAVFACARREAPRHARAEQATDLPRDVLFYPHVLYGGDAAYLVEGRWYRPGADGWVVFTEEPLELELVRHALEPERATFWGQ
jgi:hypothetical protein